MSRFIFPAHPHNTMKIMPPYLDEGHALQQLDDEKDWVAQRKYNGSHMVAWVKDGEMALWNRQGEPFTTYTLTDEMRRCFTALDLGDKEAVLDGELLHTKAKSKITGKQAADNTIVLYDLLYLDGYLLTETFPQRYEMLAKLCKNPTKLEPKSRALVVSTCDDSFLWLAEMFEDDFVYRFYEMFEFDGKGSANDGRGNDRFPEIEGLVCKRRGRASTLRLGNVAYDVNWMMRVRKTKEKIYLF